MSAYWNSLWAIALLAPFQAEAACNLTMKWGLESTENFRELSEYADEDSTTGPKLRAFRMSSQGGKASQLFFARHDKLVDAYRVAHPGPSAIPRSAFVAYAKTADPYYVTLGRSLAPSLYFDFTGNSDEYVLDQVEVQTFKFEEYKGGGFFDGEAWYDIELAKTPGTRVINVKKRLRFTGSGRAELKFFSSNYYPNVAMTPQGSFTIGLTFIFLHGAERCPVKTGRFMLDA